MRAEAPEQAVVTGAPELLYLIEFTAGSAWMADKPFREQTMAADHSMNVKRLRDAGLLPWDRVNGATGMLILRATSEAAARSEIEKDPTINAKVFSYTLEEFSPFYGGCVEVPEPSATPPAI